MRSSLAEPHLRSARALPSPDEAPCPVASRLVDVPHKLGLPASNGNSVAPEALAGAENVPGDSLPRGQAHLHELLCRGNHNYKQASKQTNNRQTSKQPLFKGSGRRRPDSAPGLRSSEVKTAGCFVSAAAQFRMNLDSNELLAAQQRRLGRRAEEGGGTLSYFNTALVQKFDTHIVFKAVTVVHFAYACAVNEFCTVDARSVSTEQTGTCAGFAVTCKFQYRVCFRVDYLIFCF